MAKIVILAGGRGTRISNYLNGAPKSLAKLNGVTLIEYQLMLAKKFHFKSILLLLGHKSNEIIDFCEKNNNFGLDISYKVEENELGTAGAILDSIDLLDEVNIVMYGDTFLNVNLENFLSQHHKNEACISIYVHPNDHPSDSDLVVTDANGYVQKFVSYPHDGIYQNLVNAALYVVEKSALELYRNNIYKHDIAKDFFPNYIKDGKKIYAYKGFEYIKDCGTPQRLKEVELDILSNKAYSRLLESVKRAIFIDRDGTLNKINNSEYIKNPEQLNLVEGVGLALKKINHSDYLSILITNQPVIARGDVDFDTLKQIHNYLEYLIGLDGAYLDEIYYCPHHPDNGFLGEVKEYKIKCDCRKPSLALINNAVKKFNIDLSHSWMIGDTTTDISTGLNADISTILVETGKKGLDGKYKVYPDYTFPTLDKSIDFITTTFPKLLLTFERLDKNLRHILIGGYSRSGKSNLASAIKFFYKNKCGRRVHKISTDRWILSGINKGGKCIDRHDYRGFLDFLTKCNGGQNFSYKLPYYSKADNVSYLDSDAIIINSDDLIIFEGVLVNFINKFGYKFFVDIERDEYLRRITDAYKFREYSDLDMKRVLDERLEEYSDIMKSYSYDELFRWEK